MTRIVRIGAKCMPGNSTHLEYDANAADWLRARDVFVREAAGKDISSDFFAPSAAAIFADCSRPKKTAPFLHHFCTKNSVLPKAIPVAQQVAIGPLQDGAILQSAHWTGRKREFGKEKVKKW